MALKYLTRKFHHLQKYQIEHGQLNDNLMDEQTNFSNLTYRRKFLEEKLRQSKNQPFALLAIKINGFSAINTNFGFDTGDQVIYKVSQLLKEFLKGKGFLYRLYGNEWEAVIHPLRSEKYIIKLAQQMIKKIQEPFKIHDHIIHLNANIGINLIEKNDKRTIDTILQQTHTALRKAVERGSGHYQLYSSEMSNEAYKAIQLESDLYQAFDNHELFLKYEPQVDIKTQTVTGAEALLHWDHPVWSDRYPYQLISRLDQNDYLHEKVAHFVIDTICKQIKNWRRKGIPEPKVSVKLFAKIFLNPDFENWIKATLKKYMIPAECLEIEILESYLLQNSEIAKKQINHLHKIGVQFCLGDLGTNYSTITYLKDLPIQKIKIDRSFIDNLDKSEQNKIIVRSIIDIGKKLGITVCAEGVKTSEQLQILREFECDTAQGSYICLPLSHDKVSEWFTAKHFYFTKKLERDQKNRRKYFRVNLPLPLSTQMTIISFRNQKVSLGTAEVLVIDLSPGGLRFISYLQLPVQENIIYQFSSELNHTSFQVNGKIIWFEEIHPGIYEYGLEFTISEIERNKIVHLLFQITPRLRDNPYSLEGNFISKNPIIYIKQNFLI